ncbi:MAG: hypothetical protein JWL68_1058 [Actinomycetia bacterium]|nr:hypothetical protein [Actinomycetes bacterium]
MSLAALFTWIITAGGGLYLLTIWLIEYDREFQSAAATRLPVPVISAHALLAVAGLVVWGGYLITDTPRLAYAAAVTLLVVATLGVTMAARWIRVYRAHDTAAVRGARAGIAVPPERNFPLPVVIGHGIFAAATIVLVVVTALGELGS